MQGFADQSEFSILKIPDASMQHMRGGHADSGAEIRAVNDHTIYTLQGQVTKSADAINPSANDQHGGIWVFLNKL